MGSSIFKINDTFYEIDEVIELARRGLGALNNKTPTKSRLARALNVDWATLYRWSKQETEPLYAIDDAKLKILAEFWLKFNTMELEFLVKCDDMKNETNELLRKAEEDCKEV